MEENGNIGTFFNSQAFQGIGQLVDPLIDLARRQLEVPIPDP